MPTLNKIHFFVFGHLQKHGNTSDPSKRLRSKLPANWMLLHSQPMETAPPHWLTFLLVWYPKMDFYREMTWSFLTCFASLHFILQQLVWTCSQRIYQYNVIFPPSCTWLWPLRTTGRYSCTPGRTHLWFHCQWRWNWPLCPAGQLFCTSPSGPPSSWLCCMIWRGTEHMKGVFFTKEGRQFIAAQPHRDTMES